MNRLLVLLALASSLLAQKTIYLRSTPPGDVRTVVMATNTTPVVITTAKPHGFTVGQTVQVYGVRGNRSANGIRTVAEILSPEQFSIADKATGQSVAGSGDYIKDTVNYQATGVVAPVAEFRLRAHPRVLLDGPDGALTNSLSQKRSANKLQWQSLLRGADSRLASYHNDVTRFRSNTWSWPLAAALAWRAGSGNERHLEGARHWLNRAEMVTPTLGADPTQPNGGNVYTELVHRSAATFGHVYDLLRDSLTEQERAAFRNKVLNDETSGCVNQQFRGTGTITISRTSTQIIGSETSFLSEVRPGDVVLSLSGGTTNQIMIVQSVESDTVLNIVAKPGANLNGVKYNISHPWESSNCGMVWFQRFSGMNPMGISRPDDLGCSGAYMARMGKNTSNHMPSRILSYLSLALAMADEDPRAERLLQEAFLFWYDFVFPFQKDYFTSGFNAGGSGYSKSRVYTYNVMIVTMLRNAFESLPYDFLEGQWIRGSWEQFVYGLMPFDTSQGLRWGEGGAARSDLTSLYMHGIFMLPHLYPNEPEGAIVDNWIRTRWGGWNSSSLVGYDATGAIFAFLYVPSEPLGNTAVTALPTQRLMNNSDPPLTAQPSDFAMEAIISRTGWTSPDDTHIFVQLFDAMIYDHTFTDITKPNNPGSYKIIKGNYLLGEDYGNNSWGINCGSPTRGCLTADNKSSNYIEIGGSEGNLKLPANLYPGGYADYQDIGVRRWAGRDDGGDSQSRYMYAMADLTGAYKPAAGAARVHRHFAHLKQPGTQDYFVVYDDVATNPGVLKRTYLHYAHNGGGDEGSTVLEGNTVISTSNNPAAQNAFHGRLVSKILSSGPLYIYTDNPNGTYTGGRGQTFRVSVCPAAAGGSACDNSPAGAEWIVVHQPTKSTDATLPDTTLIDAGAGFTGVEIGGNSPKAVLFSRGGALHSAVSFVTRYNGVGQVLITGLEPGIYNVHRNGALAVSGVTVHAGDSTLYLEEGSGSYTVSRQGTIAELVIETESLPVGTRGVAYDATLRAVGGQPPYNWTLVENTLPVGVNLASDGRVSGVPQQEEAVTVRIQVSDSGGLSVDRWFTLLVTGPPSEQLQLTTVFVGVDVAVVRYGKPSLSTTEPCLLTLSSSDSFDDVIESVMDTGGAWPREYQFGSAVPLQPGFHYSAKVECGAETAYTQFVTDAGVNPAVFLRVRSRNGFGQAPAKFSVQYGADPSALTESVTAPCTSWCSTAIPVSDANAPLYVQRTYLTQEGHVIATSVPERVQMRQGSGPISDF